MSDNTEIQHTDDGSIHTTVTATAPEWALRDAARELATFDEPLDEWHIRELIDNQLQPAVVYRTLDGERGVDRVRELVARLEVEDSD
jgi:hypothetical protein